jgi:hypothetical protein
MKYDFLTDEVIKMKLISLGSRIEENDVVKRQMNRKKEFEFEFYNKEFYKDPLPVDYTNSSVIVTLNEETINKLFLKEIRKEKLLKINQVLADSKVK